LRACAEINRQRGGTESARERETAEGSGRSESLREQRLRVCDAERLEGVLHDD